MWLLLPPGLQRSHKASNIEEKPASTMHDGGPSGGKLSAHGGKDDLAEESWGLQKPKEFVSTYASRVMSHLREYEEASKTIRRLRKELRCTSAKAAGSSRPKKTQLQAEVKEIKLDINELEVRKTFLREKSGSFKEKLMNEDRFREMADNREQRQMGLQPESQVDDDDYDQQKAPPASLLSHPQASCSELPAGQATLASGRSSAGSGEDSDNSGQGGALMAEIKLLESPVCLQNFHLGDDLPEEAPGDQKKKAKTTKPKLQEVRPSGWEEAFGGSIRLSWKKRT
ncbi:uncharacterized protein [Dendrobates tinctorius]|uniref:uncharacterized protein n=1 Tax=Dendrobates tinctorius TaxID=92724 RepID=UPI003CCA01F7